MPTSSRNAPQRNGVKLNNGQSRTPVPTNLNRHVFYCRGRCPHWPVVTRRNGAMRASIHTELNWYVRPANVCHCEGAYAPVAIRSLHICTSFRNPSSWTIEHIVPQWCPQIRIGILFAVGDGAHIVLFKGKTPAVPGWGFVYRALGSNGTVY